MPPSPLPLLLLLSPETASLPYFPSYPTPSRLLIPFPLVGRTNSLADPVRFETPKSLNTHPTLRSFPPRLGTLTRSIDPARSCPLVSTSSCRRSRSSRSRPQLSRSVISLAPVRPTPNRVRRGVPTVRPKERSLRPPCANLVSSPHARLAVLVACCCCFFFAFRLFAPRVNPSRLARAGLHQIRSTRPSRTAAMRTLLAQKTSTATTVSRDNRVLHPASACRSPHDLARADAVQARVARTVSARDTSVTRARTATTTARRSSSVALTRRAEVSERELTRVARSLC